MTSSHVLLFDSGLGGLSIAAELRKLMPSIRLSYLADNAMFPYGELDADTLQARMVALLKPAYIDNLQIDLVVIACNTASTVVLDALRQQLTIPIVGVVPAIKPAAQQSRSCVIGLLATPGTVDRSYTQQLIDNFAPHCKVLKLGSSQLVKLAEQQPADLQQQVHSILTPWREHPSLDTVVLGCTHFPLIRDQLALALGPNIQLIDSGAAVAQQTHHCLATTHSATTNTDPSHLREVSISQAVGTAREVSKAQLSTSYFTNPGTISYSQSQTLIRNGFNHGLSWFHSNSVNSA